MDWERERRRQHLREVYVEYHGKPDPDPDDPSYWGRNRRTNPLYGQHISAGPARRDPVVELLNYYKQGLNGRGEVILEAASGDIYAWPGGYSGA